MHIITAADLQVRSQQAHQQTQQPALRGEILAFPVADAESAIAWHRQNVRVELPSAERWWLRAPEATSWLAIFHSGNGETADHVQAGEGFDLDCGNRQYSGTVIGVADERDCRTTRWILLAGDGDMPVEVDPVEVEAVS